jgi:hypothetical protein
MHFKDNIVWFPGTVSIEKLVISLNQDRIGVCRDLTAHHFFLPQSWLQSEVTSPWRYLLYVSFLASDEKHIGWGIGKGSDMLTSC